MNDFELISYLITAIGFGLVLLVFSFKWLKEKRLIENIPTSKIRSIAMGLVEITGIAVGDKFVTSPLTGERCYYYKYLVSELINGRTKYWKTLFSEEAHAPFYLKDEGGQVLINPMGAKLNIPESTKYDFSNTLGRRRKQYSMEDLPDAIKIFMESKGKPVSSPENQYRQFKFVETTIKNDLQYYIMGAAGNNSQNYIENTTNNVGNIIIQQSKNEKFFYISDKSEQTILKKYKYLVPGGFFGGSLFILLALYLLIEYKLNVLGYIFVFLCSIAFAKFIYKFYK